ncbi:MAG: alkaline phosphatase family protein [Novosphingobium sp.]
MRPCALTTALAALTALASVPALAGDGPAPAEPPRLIVAVSVDQFSADLFAQYRRHFTGGLARLQGGVVFPSAFQGHAATETCPGHSTLLTGVRPGRNGIIANNWFDLSLTRADKRVYCSEDVTDPESKPDVPVVSPRFLKVPTLGEWMKRQWPASRNVAVSGKDRAVMMMGGHRIDEGYWWKGNGFATFKGGTLSPAAIAENAVIAKAVARGGKAFAPATWCASVDRAVSVGKAGEIGKGRFPAPASDVTAFARSPRLDAATLSLAGRLVDQMKLGRGEAPDILSVSLSATDYIGHSVGNEGVEMCIQMAELDRGLGAFFARLDKAKIDYAVVLSADHGGIDTAERLSQQALPRAVRVDPALSPGALGKAIAAELGITGIEPLVYGDAPFGDMYLSRSLTPAQRGRALDALVAKLRAHPQVAAAYAAGELAATPTPSGSPQDWTLRDRARASFDPERSGDVVVLLDRAVAPIPSPAKGYTATHGSPWDYDRRVPLIFWRKGINGFEQPAPVETVDIAPTLASVLKLKVPDGSFDGRCLDLDGSAGNSCQ